MGKKADKRRKEEEYDESLYELWIELVKLQKHNIARDVRLLVVLEGRDAAGKDGAIKRIVEHLSPRETRVVALPKPNERERTTWYFQRWVAHLPAADEFVLFNRSWYNRAGVEQVMGFASAEQVENFFAAVPTFERLLVDSGIVLFKYYLDISREEQAQRLKARSEDPLKQWKISPIDAVALEHYDDYTRARDRMLARTHNKLTPWTVVRADSKKDARLNLIRDLLSRLDYKGKRKSLCKPDRDIVRNYEPRSRLRGFLAR
jgi:polyphosphate kinase 2